MLAFFLLLFTGFGIVNQDNTLQQVEDLVGNSKFIFKGRVLKLNATTMPDIVPATDGTVVVKVEEIILAPETLDDFTDQEITVSLIKPGSVRAGEEALFFTNGWLYGRSLAVREVGRTRADGDPVVLRKQVSEVRQRAADQNLQRRLAQAELVVVGTVSLTRPSRGQARRARITEHEPDWWEAVIQVESVLKGQPPQPNVIVLYPKSIDVMWYGSPKFVKGQKGVFLLHREQRSDFQVDGFTALDPLDFQPIEQADRVKRLVNNIR